jgi:UDP-glucuronate 4-epimerase
VSRYLVTGAAGFIGSHVVDRLLADGHEVVGVDAFTSYYSRRRKEGNLAAVPRWGGFRLVEGDVLRLDLDGLLCGVRGVFHLAGEPGVRRSWGDNFPRYVERNVLTTERLLEAVWRTGVARFVYASSSSVYGGDSGGPLAEDDPLRPASPYGLSKLAAEELIRLHARERGVSATILRYFTVYGPRQRPEMALSRFVSAALRGRCVEIYGDGEQRRDVTYVADAVSATVAALDAPPGLYNVGGGTRASVNEMLRAVREETGTSVEVRYGPVAPGDVPSTWADSSRAACFLGYAPRVGLEEGLSAQVSWAVRESLPAATV